MCIGFMFHLDVYISNKFQISLLLYFNEFQCHVHQYLLTHFMVQDI